MRRLASGLLVAAAGFAVLAPASQAAPAPNLRVVPISAIPSGDGTSVAVSFAIVDGGDAAAPASHWALYLSDDAVLDAGDVLARERAAAPLAAGAQLTVSTGILLPAGTSSGTHCVLIRADSQDEVAESDETDNVGSVCFSLTSAPNLVLQSFTAAPSAPPTGGAFPLGLTLRNDGNAEASASSVGVYLSTDGSLGGDTLLAQVPAGAVAAGASLALAPTVTLPALAPGHYVLFAVADDGGAVTESREDDNVVSRPLDVLAPNLVVHLLAAPASVPPSGGSIDVTFTIENVGTVTAGASSWAVWLSTDGVLSGDDSRLRQTAIAAIAAGGSSAFVTTAVPMPGGVEAGPRCVLIQADALGQVDESSETDNLVSTCLTVEAAIDLRVSSFTAPESITVHGGPAEIALRVENAGNAPAAASRVDVVLAAPGGDLVLAQLPVPALPAFGSSNVSATVAVPPLPAGTYSLRAVADAGGAVVETDEGNNLAAASLLVYVPPDTTPPVTSASAGPGGTLVGWNRLPVTLQLHAVDESGVRELHVLTGAGETVISGADASIPVGAEGETEIEFWAIDVYGNEEARQTVVVRVDTGAPEIACVSPDSLWHAENVAFSCTAVDGVSGLADTADASFDLVTSVAPGAESAAAATGTRTVCDAAGNCAGAGPIEPVRVDRRPPGITIGAPTGTYLVGAPVVVDFACTDGGSGVAACEGSLPDGAALATGAPGIGSFEVEAADAVGHVTRAEATYTVTYGICPAAHAPPGPVGGPLVRVWLRVCDASGADVSDRHTVVTALDVDGSPLPRLPASHRFHREPFGYRYDLDGRDLAPGVHVLHVRISGDPVVHAVSFTVPAPKAKPPKQTEKEKNEKEKEKKAAERFRLRR